MSAAGMLMAACCCKKGQVCNCPSGSFLFQVTVTSGANICCTAHVPEDSESLSIKGFEEITVSEVMTFEPPEFPICYPVGGITRVLTIDDARFAVIIIPPGSSDCAGEERGDGIFVGAGLGVVLECGPNQPPKWSISFQAGSATDYSLVTNPTVVIEGDSPASSGSIGVTQPGPGCNENGNLPIKWPDMSATYSITPIGARAARGMAAGPTRVVTRHTLTREPGPALWRELHFFAKRFAGDVNAALLFLTRLAWRLPGGCDCIRKYQRRLISHPPALDSAESFFRWTWELHNHVNEDTGKAAMPFEDADALYDATATDSVPPSLPSSP